MPQSILVSWANAWFQPLDYCTLLITDITKSDLHLLQKAQNSLARAITMTTKISP